MRGLQYGLLGCAAFLFIVWISPVAESAEAARCISFRLPGSRFTENAGQLRNNKVRLYCASRNLQMGFGESTVFLRLSEPEAGRSVGLRMVFPEARRVVPQGRGELQLRSHFLRGNDRSRWQRGVRSYREVVYTSLFEGIDLVFLADEGSVKSEFRVRPGADPRQIVVAYEGIEGLDLDGATLVVRTQLGDLRETVPEAYRGDGERVQCRYVCRDQTSYGFACRGWEISQSLTIDPLIYSTFLGGSDGENAYGLDIDGAGNAYVTGETSSTDFPDTLGAYDGDLDGIKDAFVAKLNPSGTALVYATYLGGTKGEVARSIRVDSFGNAFVIGDTGSSDFPTTEGAYDRVFSTGSNPQDLFVVKLNAAGSDLVYGTYIGGTAAAGDWGNFVTVDGDGNAYVTGYTQSTDFPTTNGAYDESHNGGLDAFVVKLDDTGGALAYSTFLGGANTDAGYTVRVELQQGQYHAYVAGFTESSNFPTTAGALSETPKGGTDAFVTRINPAGSALEYSTYLGGSSFDAALGLAVDDNRSAYVTGGTASFDFPATFVCGDPRDVAADLYVAKLTPSGDGLVYATVLGGSEAEYGNAIALDSDGSARVTGWTRSADFPITLAAAQREPGGQEDALVLKLDPTGELTRSTYLGGGGRDEGFAIAVAADGSAYVAGGTGSGAFPTTDGALDRSQNGGEAFVAKLDDPPPPDTTTEDHDGDSLKDMWELCGLDADGDGTTDLYLSSMGADPGRKDVFVEVDYMDGHHLLGTTRTALVDAFEDGAATNPEGDDGVVIHIVVDEKLAHADEMEWPGEFDTLKSVHFGRPGDRQSPNSTAVLEAWKMVFHYSISAHKIRITDSGGGTHLVAGIAEVGANDFAIALGFDSFGLNADATHRVGSSAEQAGVFMHELGHNLALRHGGGDDINFKPNYRSVMNYSWTTPASYGYWKLDYSRRAQATLTENWTLACQRDYGTSSCPYPKLNETVAMDGDAGDIIVHGPPLSGTYVVSPADARIDWNQDGDTDDTNSVANLNCLEKNDSTCSCGGPACAICCDSDSREVLHGYDDWQNLGFDFRSSPDYSPYSHQTAEVEEIERATRLLRGGEPSGPAYRDDDGSRETFASIDYNDDLMEKQVELTVDPAEIELARLWIYGQPYNYEGFDFEDREDLHVRVNNVAEQDISFDVGQLLSFQTQIYQWVKIDIPTGWLLEGTNSFRLYGQYPQGAWDHNNIRVGVDTDSDQDRSFWYGNGLTCGNPGACMGELMIFLEWATPPLPSRQLPGDCSQDGVLDLTDAVCTLGYLYTGDPVRLPCGVGSREDPANVALLDWQPDGEIDLSDGVASLTFLYVGGPPHPLAVPGAPLTGCVVIPDCPNLCKE